MKHNKQQQYTVTHNYEFEIEPLTKFTKIDKFSKEPLFFIKIHDVKTTQGLYESKENLENYGIVNQKQLSDVLDFPHLIDNSKLTLKKPIEAMKEGFLSYLTETGFEHHISDITKDKKDIEEFIIQDLINNKEPLDFLQNMAKDLYLKIYQDSEGKFYSEPFVFDYISGNLDNSRYDLDKLVEHLLQRKDIAFITNPEGYSYKQKILKGSIDSEDFKDIIGDIPSYNAYDNKTECIRIIYYPQSQDIEKILNYNKEQTPNYYDLNTFIIGEILGCDVCSNNNDTIETPKRKFKR